MLSLNQLLHRLAHDYLLITVAAVIFFAIKSWIGYRTYKHYNRKLNRLERLLAESSLRTDRRE